MNNEREIKERIIALGKELEKIRLETEHYSIQDYYREEFNELKEIMRIATYENISGVKRDITNRLDNSRVTVTVFDLRYKLKTIEIKVTDYRGKRYEH